MTIPRLGSPYLSDYLGYESSQIIIISNASAERKHLFLRGKVEQLNRPGYYLRTKSNFRPLAPITLEPFETKTLFASSGDFGFLEEKNLEDNVPSSIRRNIQLNGILPEGDYQICIQAFDFNTETPVSPEEPVGCQFFTVTLGSPPQLIFPMCNDTIENLYPNFIWTPAISTVPLQSIEYTLYIVEYNSHALNPAEVMEQSITYNAGNPIIKRQLLSNSYPFNPTDLPLRQGKTYIACVVATDRRSGATFENRGRSEICIFHTAKSIPGSDISNVILTTPTTGPTFNVPDYYSVNFLKGNLRYYWKQPGYSTSFNNKGENVNPSNLNLPVFQIQGGSTAGNNKNSGGGQFSQFTNVIGGFGQSGSLNYNLTGISAVTPVPGIGTLSNNSAGNIRDAGIQGGQIGAQSNNYGNLSLAKAFNYEGYNNYMNSALAGMDVSLILGKQLAVSNSCYDLAPNNIYAEGIILASATTAADGSFSFNLPLLDEIDFGWRNYLIPSTQGGLDGGCAGVVLARNVLMIKLAGSHSPYLHPVQAVAGIPDNRDMGNIYCQVNTISSKIKLEDTSNASESITGMEILLLRRPPVSSKFPMDAFTPGIFRNKETLNINGIDYQIFMVSQNSVVNNEITIHNIPMQGCPDTHFWVYSRPKDNYSVSQNYSNSPSKMYVIKENKWNDCVTNAILNNDLNCTLSNCTDNLNILSILPPQGNELFFHKQRMYKGPPRIIAKIINNAASGEMSDLAKAEPGVNWRIWAVSHWSMKKIIAHFSSLQWGGIIESPLLNLDLIKNIATSGCNLAQSQGHVNAGKAGMFVTHQGTTGNDGRINQQVGTWILSSNMSAGGCNPELLLQGKQVGYFYFVEVFKEGFKKQHKAVNKSGTINSETGDMGYAASNIVYNLNEIVLQTKGKAELYFRNTLNQNVSAKQVYYIDPATGQAGVVKKSRLKNIEGLGWRQSVTLDVPSGNIKIVVVPENEDQYASDTITVQVQENIMLKKEVIVPFKLHRIRFIVQSENGSPVQHVRLRLLNSNADFNTDIICPAALNPDAISRPNPWQGYTLDSDRYTNASGIACFAFKSAGTQFDFRITGPPDMNFVVTNKRVNSVAGKKWVTINVEIKEGRTVRGKVSFNTNPVVKARVRIKNSNPLLEVWTDQNGEYEIRGVPKDTLLTFTASKSGYVGVEYTEGIFSNFWQAFINRSHQNNVTTLNFNLRVYDGLDLSKILGYTAEITALTEKIGADYADVQDEINSGLNNTGVVEASGIIDLSNVQDPVIRFNQTNANDQIIQSVDFDKIVLIADNIVNTGNMPFARPEKLPMATTHNQINVRIFDKYQALFKNQATGIQLNKINNVLDNTGFLQGRIQILATTFNSGLLNFNGEILLSHNVAALNPNMIPAFSSGNQSIFSNTAGIAVSGAGNADFEFRYSNISCKGVKNTSRLYPDSMTVLTVIQTDFQYCSQKNVDLDIGNIRLIPSEGVENVEKIINKTTLLQGDFEFQWLKVRFNNTGIRFDGNLKARGMVLPVVNALLYPNQFSLPSQSLQLQSMSIMGVVPLHLQQNTSVDFGFDSVEKNAWYLNLFRNNGYAATISGAYLTGLPQNLDIRIQSMWLYSNGSELINIYGTNVATLSGIIDATIQNIYPSKEYFKLPVILELGIPGFNIINTDLLFTVNQSGSALNHYIIENRSWNNELVNNFIIGFHPDNHQSPGHTGALSLASGRLEITGTITNLKKEIFKDIKVRIIKTTNNIQLVIQDGINQSMRLGADLTSPVEVTTLSGNMSVQNGSWQSLHINGDMPEALGFTPDGKRVRFDVISNGGLSMSNQQIKLQNMGGALSGMNMAYDMIAHRLMGQMSFSENVGQFQVQGSSEIVVDKFGYYFMANGSFNMSNPNVEGVAFIIFGDYAHKSSDLKNHIENTLKPVSYFYQNVGKLPKGFTDMSKISGFYMSAGSKIPFPALPNFDLNVGIAQAKLEINIGCEVRVGIQFGNVNSYNFGFGVFIDAEIGVGGSVLVGCAGVLIYGKAGFDFDGTYHSNGNWSVTATGFLILGGCAYVGAGLACDADCAGACVKVEFCGEVSFILGGTLSNSGSNWHISFGADNTSEQ
jgi:hypothetical protein